MTHRVPKRVLAHILDTPWAITEDSLSTVLEIVHRDNGDLEAVAAKLGRPLDNTRAVSVRDGVATIPVSGPLMRHASLFSAISGATSYEDLATDLTAAIDDPKVKAILLAIDSPGGEVTGVSDLAQMIRAAGSAKPIVAHVEGLGASAAYWLASAASQVVASSTALLGSIGVRTAIVDRTAADASRGVKVHEIISSQSPGKASDPATTEGRARIQATVDAIAAAFIADVAKYRGVSADKVITDFGGGHVLVGQAAVDAGLADSIGTYESVHADLAARANSSRPSGTRAAASTQERIMKTKDEVAAEHPDWVAQWKAEGRQEAAAENTTAVDAAAAAASTAERERILAIDALPISGHATLIKTAKADPACTAAMASQRVIEAEATVRGAALANIQQAERNLPAPKSAPSVDAGGEPSAREHGRSIAARYRKLTSSTPNRS